jgi:catechol 2,3-dioxygenase-like lactoylglutathione lyase family enzyme
MTLQLNQINLVVADMAASVAFYERLGLARDTRMPMNDHHTEFHIGEAFSLELDSAAMAKAYNSGWTDGAAPGARTVIGFAVASRAEVDRLYTDLTAAGYRFAQAPCDAFWGARYAIVRDPDGNQIGLMSPVDPSKRSAPPAL